MAGIVNGGIAACRRTTYCLRFLRLPYRPLDLCQSLATPHHRRRNHNSSSGNESGRDQLHQLKSAQVGQGQGQKEQPGKGSGGSEVRAAPPDPQDVPGEKRTESPHEVRPGLPLEAQPHHTPLEVKPPQPHPHTIICSSDSKAPTLGSEVLGAKAAKGTDRIGKKCWKNVRLLKSLAPFPTESEPKSDNSLPNERPASTIDDPKYQAPPNKSELQSKESTFLSIESRLNSLTTIVNEFKEDPRNQDLSSIKSELTSQSSSPNDSKSGVTQGQAEAKNELKSQASLSTKAESKSQDCLQAEKKYESQATSGILQVDPPTSPSSSKPLSSNADLVQSSQPNAVDSFASSGGQNSSYRFLGEGKIAGDAAEAETLVYSSAKDGYGSQYGQMVDTDPELKRPETADTVKEDVVDSEIIDQWVDKFKRYYMAENAAFGLDNENEVSASTDKKSPEIPSTAPNVGPMVKKNNVWVSRSSDTAETPAAPSEAACSTTMTKKISPGQTLPLKIVAKDEAPTDFRQSRKPLLPSELKSNKDAQFEATGAFTKPIEFILQQQPTADAKVIAADTSKSAEILNIVQEKTPGETTEEIVAMFAKDSNGELTKTEEGRVQEFFETFDGLSRSQDPGTTVLDSAKSSQADVLVMSASGSEKTGHASPNETGKIFQAQADSKLTKLEKPIVAKEDAEVPKKKDDSDNDLTIQGGSIENVKGEKDQVVGKLADKDKSFDQSGFDLAKKVSSFIKSANEPDATKKVPTQKEKSAIDEAIGILNDQKDQDQKGKPKPETTSMLPGDLYDPVASEVSGPMETMMTEVEESEDLNPGLEAPEVRAGSRKDEPKVTPPQAKDESKAKEDEKAPDAEKPVRKERPKLDDGELSMKLLDRVSAEMPPPATEIPGSATAAQSPAQKSLIQKLFDKILGRGGKSEGKRHMSTYSVRRQLSTSCTLPVPPRLVSEFESNSKRELKPDHEAPLQEPDTQPSTVELFAKDTKDLTKIRGGSQACSNPKKSPRDLLREKQESKKIKILGGSEECAKKMKRLKKLIKDSDDDCNRHFSRSLSDFLRQLRVSLRTHFTGVTELSPDDVRPFKDPGSLYDFYILFC